MNDLEKVAPADDAANACNVSKETENECVETTSPALDLAAAADEAVEKPAGEVNSECAVEESPALDLAVVADNEENNVRRYHSLDKDGLIAELKGILDEDRMEAHKEVGLLKQAFFNIKTKENLDLLNAYIDEGNDPASFASPVDEKENEFKKLYTEFKERRSAYLAADEARRQENLEKRNAILAQLKAITEDIDNVNVRFPEFQQLQQDFKAIKDIPATAETESWKQFQNTVEQFYDHLKMNKELRDLDFKKNLEAKKALIEEARKLEEVNDVVAAFRSLQAIHEEWRNIGPVAKEIRESLWDEFKAVSTVINRRHQDFFEKRKAEEQANEEAKVKLCEEIEGMDYSALNSFNEWNAMSDQIIALQKRWRELGFASRKVNTALYARFREACDKFFNAKSEYFQKTRSEINEKIARKTALCEKAEALQGMDDVKKAASEIVKLQAEWKKIGGVPRKQGDLLWARFQAASDAVFGKRKQLDASRHQEEKANLEKKRAIIAELKELPKDGNGQEVLNRVKALQADWKEIGFVPFQQKDTIYAEFRAICDELFGAYARKASQARKANFQNRVAALKEDGRGLNRERDRLVHALDAKKAEVKTVENNMGFFSVKSSAGNTLVKDMERRLNKLKEDIKQIEEKIAILDAGE